MPHTLQIKTECGMHYDISKDNFGKSVKVGIFFKGIIISLNAPVYKNPCSYFYSLNALMYVMSQKGVYGGSIRCPAPGNDRTSKLSCPCFWKRRICISLWYGPMHASFSPCINRNWHWEPRSIWKHGNLYLMTSKFQVCYRLMFIKYTVN